LINTETGSEEVWCEIKKSNLINANVLRTVEINSKEILDDNVKVVDSLTNEYKLDEKGVLNLIRKDSVRYTSSTLEQ
jgi:cell division ATPase FtsA